MLRSDQEIHGPVAVLIKEFFPSCRPPARARKRGHELKELILAVARNRPKLVEEINRMVKREALKPWNSPRIIRRTIKNVISKRVAGVLISQKLLVRQIFKPGDGFLIYPIQYFLWFSQ